MKTNLPQHHNDAIEQMLDATYDAEDEHDLLLQLKTVATYLERAINHKHERAINFRNEVQMSNGS